MRYNKICKITYRYQTKNKWKTFMIYGILSLLVTVFFVINQISEDIPAMKLNMAYQREGKQSFLIISPTEENIMNLSKDKNVHAIGSMYSYGVDAQTGLEFIYEDKKYQGCFYHKYGDSKNVNEIILSETYYKKHRCQIGDTMEVNLSKKDADGEIVLSDWKQSFVIVGKVNSIPENRVIVSDKFFQENKKKPDQTAVILVDNSNIEGMVQSFVHQYHITGRIRINESIENAMEYKKEIYKNNFLIQWILTLFTIFLSTYLLNGILNKRRIDIGIMRSIGIERRAIYLAILLEGFCYIFFSIILGSFVAKCLIKSKALYRKNMALIALAMCFAVIPGILRFIFLIRRENPVDMIRDIRTSVNKLSLKKRFCSTKIPVMVKYALRNIGRQPIKTFLTVLMLIFSMSLICGIYAYFGTERSYEWIHNYIPGDAVLTDQGMESMAMPSEVFNKDIVDIIKKMEGIKTVEEALIKECNLYLPTGQIDKRSGLYKEEFDNNGRTGYFAANFVAFGVDSLEKHFNGCKYKIEDSKGYSGDVKRHLNFPNKKEFSVLHCVISPQLAEFANVNVGGHMAIEFAYQSADDRWVQNVADVIVVNIAEENPAIALESEGVLPHVYFELSELQDLTESMGVNRLDVIFKNNYERSQVLGELRNITLPSYVVNVTDYQEYYTSQKTDDSAENLLKRTVCILCCFLMGICCIDIIYTGLMNRKEELSVLHLIGIKNSNIKLSLVLENLIYSFWALLFIIPIEAILVLANYYLFNQVSIDTKLIISYLVFDIMMLLVNFVISAIIVEFQLKNINSVC